MNFSVFWKQQSKQESTKEGPRSARGRSGHKNVKSEPIWYLFPYGCGGHPKHKKNEAKPGIDWKVVWWGLKRQAAEAVLIENVIKPK